MLAQRLHGVVSCSPLVYWETIDSCELGLGLVLLSLFLLLLDLLSTKKYGYVPYVHSTLHTSFQLVPLSRLASCLKYALRVKTKNDGLKSPAYPKEEYMSTSLTTTYPTTNI